MSYTNAASSGTVVAGGNETDSAATQLKSPHGIYSDSFAHSLIIIKYENNNTVY